MVMNMLRLVTPPIIYIAVTHYIVLTVNHEYLTVDSAHNNQRAINIYLYYNSCMNA